MLVSPARAVANDDEAGTEQETLSLHQCLFHLAMKQMAQDSFIMTLSFLISFQAPALSLYCSEDASSFILCSLHSFLPHSVLCLTNTHVFTGLSHFASPFILIPSPSSCISLVYFMHSNLLLFSLCYLSLNDSYLCRGGRAIGERAPPRTAQMKWPFISCAHLFSLCLMRRLWWTLDPSHT